MKYLRKFNERNITHANSIISKKMDSFNKLKDLLSKNQGYIGKFTEFLMNNNVPYSELEDMYSRLNNLSKNQLSFDISKLTYEQVLDRLIIEENNLKVRKILNQFPSEQKNIIKKEIENDNKNIQLILKMYDKKDRLNYFLSKVSSYKDFYSLKNAISLFIKDGKNDKESIKEFIDKSKDTKILIEKDNIMIVIINSYEDNLELASDTSWCILKRHMWDIYTRGRYQYIIYDFSKDEFDPSFKIGLTLDKNGSIRAAHDMLDGGYVTQVNKLLSDNNIKINDLLPEIEKSNLSLSISDITSKTLLRDLESLKSSILITEYPDFIRKIIETSKDISPKRIELILDLVKKYFKDVEFITRKDLNNIHPNLYDLIKYDLPRMYLDESSVDTIPNEGYLKKGLEIWTDLAIINSDMDYYLLNSNGGLKSPWTMETLEILSNRYNDIYLNKKQELLKHEKSELILSKLEYFVLLTNSILNRTDKINIDFDKIKNNTPIKKLKQHPSIFKVSLTLDDIRYTSNIGDIQFIDKNSPRDVDVYINTIHLNRTKDGRMFLEELLDYLDYNLNIKISKNTLSYYRIRYRKDDKFYRLLEKIPQRVRAGMEFSDGDLKIRLY